MKRDTLLRNDNVGVAVVLPAQPQVRQNNCRTNRESPADLSAAFTTKLRGGQARRLNCLVSILLLLVLSVGCAGIPLPKIIT